MATLTPEPHSQRVVQAADFCYWIMTKKYRSSFFGKGNPGVLAFLNFLKSNERALEESYVRRLLEDCVEDRPHNADLLRWLDGQNLDLVLQSRDKVDPRYLKILLSLQDYLSRTTYRSPKHSNANEWLKL